MGTFYIGTILFLRIVQNYFSKKASTIFPITMNGRAKYLTLSFGFPAVFAFALLLVTGSIRNFDWVTVALAAGSGVALVIAQVCSLLAMQSGTMVITSVFGTAGLIIPCVCGIFFFNEPMSVWQWVGIFVFIVASYLLAASAKNSYSNFSYKTVFLLVGSFLANGTTMLCQKMLTFTNPNGNISLFSLFSFAIPAIIFALSLPFGKKENKQEKLNSKIYLPILLLAIALFIINQFATAATKYVSSAVLFALINGGNTIIAAVIAAIFYREKPTWRSITGLVLGLASLMLVNIKL